MSSLNETQLHLLKLFVHNQQADDLAKLKEVLAVYYAQKMDESLDEAWERKGLSVKDLEKAKTTDFRKISKGK